MNVEFLLLCFLLNGVDDASVLDLNAYAFHYDAVAFLQTVGDNVVFAVVVGKHFNFCRNNLVGVVYHISVFDVLNFGSGLLWNKQYAVLLDRNDNCTGRTAAEHAVLVLEEDTCRSRTCSVVKKSGKG